MSDSGQLVDGCIFRGRGHVGAPLSEFRSAVFYHDNSPTFVESIRYAS